MSKFSFPVNEMGRASATLLLTGAVAAVFFAVMPPQGPADTMAAIPTQAVHPATAVPQPSIDGLSPSLVYFQDSNPWTRNRMALGDATLPSFDTGRVVTTAETTNNLYTDYLNAYLSTPFPFSNTTTAVASDDKAGGRRIEIEYALARSIFAELNPK